MFKNSEEATTGQLIRLCFWYFLFYTITGVAVKYFTGKPELNFLGMKQIAYTTFNTVGGVITCLGVVFVAGWYRFKSENMTTLAGMMIPSEFLYIIPSGICTAVVIVTTTLIYTLFPTVMVAMVVMRASVIVISRAVDGLQISQGILKKKVYMEENIAVLFAISVVVVQIVFGKSSEGSIFDSPFGLGVLFSYLTAYSFRIYIMNYYKNTKPPGAKQNNEGFFAIEQIAATVTMVVFALALFVVGSGNTMIEEFRSTLTTPPNYSFSATIVGVAYGCVAFFSVFIFMFKGRTATFAGLVNRLTSLVAGTGSTLIIWLVFNGTAPQKGEWISLGLILVAVAFLSAAERKRASELAKTK